MSCIDGILNAAISEALPRRHRIELRKLSNELKIDLAIGLGLLDFDDRPALIKLFTYRNMFAHSPAARFTNRRARDLYNLLSTRTREILGPKRRQFEDFSGPRQVLAECLAVFFIRLEIAISQIRDRNARERVLTEIVKEELEGSRIDREKRLSQEQRDAVEKYAAEQAKKRDRRIAESIEANRKRRNEMGEL